MNLATKDTVRQRLDTPDQGQIISQNAAQKGQCPPPESVSAIVKKNYKSAMPCDLYEGALVQVYSERENLAQHNGQIGTVAGVIYSRDRNRSIIYVEIPGITPQPTFWYSELKAVTAPQATKEGVQS